MVFSLLLSKKTACSQPAVFWQMSAKAVGWFARTSNLLWWKNELKLTRCQVNVCGEPSCLFSLPSKHAEVSLGLSFLYLGRGKLSLHGWIGEIQNFLQLITWILNFFSLERGAKGIDMFAIN